MDIHKILRQGRTAPSSNGYVPPQKTLNAANDPELLQLVDQAIDQGTTDLASKLSAVNVGHGAAQVAAIPKVVGMDHGRVLVNRGAGVGLKSGQTFQVVRMADSGFKDPDTGKPIILKKKVCQLTLTEVDDNVSFGNCTGDTPQAGDELVHSGSN